MNNTANLYDVAVIGGGLAGLALAIQAARKGYKTILFEKDDYPRHKVCGEYISLESKPFLESIGIPISKIHLPQIDQFLATDVYGNQYPFKLPLGGFGISRFQLDDLLYKVAMQVGVMVCTKEKVTNVHFTADVLYIETDKGNYSARFAAGSYGKRSNLDIKWKRPFVIKQSGKLQNFIGVKYHIRFPFPGDTIALHNFKDGYCGISQIEDGKCCLCYLTTARNLKESNNSIAEMERSILFQNPALKNIFENAEFLYEEPLVISQVSFAKKDLVENHVLMIGDAAGMIPPLCGNGMSMALHSSKMAYETMDLFLQHKMTRKEMEKMYVAVWKKKFSVRVRIGRFVQRLFGRNQMTLFFLQSMRLLPFLANLVIRSTHGKVF
jgi:flavin-dependent dehydrogenase